MFGHMGGFGHGYGFGNGFNILYQLLIFTLIGVIIFLFIKKNKRHDNKFNIHSNGSKDNQPIEIAKLRYARGEISYEEYQKILNVLKQ